jgi:hypothetical protein
MFNCVKNYVETVYFVARTNRIPELIIREGKIYNKANHYVFINSGGEYFKRHEDEIFYDEDLAWARLSAAYRNWLEYTQ